MKIQSLHRWGRREELDCTARSGADSCIGLLRRQNSFGLLA